MKKNLCVILVLPVLALSLLGGCSKPEVGGNSGLSDTSIQSGTSSLQGLSDTDPAVDNTEVKQGAVAAIQDDRLYYCNTDDGGEMYGGKLYAINTDGTDKKKISDDLVHKFIVSGDRIYYCNRSDGGKLYSIKTDGTDRQRLGQDYGADSLHLLNGRIYYTTSTSPANLDFVVRSIKTDGTDRQKLSDDSIHSIKVADNQIYCLKMDADDHGQLYTMKTDGTDIRKINDDSAYDIDVVDGLIYYRDNHVDNTIFTVRTDGSDKQELK